METTGARCCPAPTAQIKLFSEIHSGHVNNDSGLAGDFIHSPPESLFTSSRNLYSHGSGIPHSHAPEYALNDGGYSYVILILIVTLGLVLLSRKAIFLILRTVQPSVYR